MNTVLNMNETNYMNGGFNMNNNVYVNGGNAMNTMNSFFGGLNINQELVTYLENALQIVSNYQDFMGRYSQAKDKYDNIQEQPQKIIKRWRLITIGVPVAVSLLAGLHPVIQILSVGGAIAATQFAKKKFMAESQEKAIAKCQASEAPFAELENQKMQIDSYTENCLAYLPQQYRRVESLSYMLEMARTGRAWDINQAYALADAEEQRIYLEEAQRELLKKQQEDAAGDKAFAVMGGLAAIGVGSFLGGCIGHVMRN